MIENLIDGQQGFQKIGEALEDETLKRYFLAERRRDPRRTRNLPPEGVVDIQNRHCGRSLRAWTSLKTALGGGAHSLLETAEEAEDAAKRAYI